MTVVVVTRDLMDGGRFRAAVPEVIVLRKVDPPAIVGIFRRAGELLD